MVPGFKAITDPRVTSRLLLRVTSLLPWFRLVQRPKGIFVISETSTEPLKQRHSSLYFRTHEEGLSQAVGSLLLIIHTIHNSKSKKKQQTVPTFANCLSLGEMKSSSPSHSLRPCSSTSIKQKQAMSLSKLKNVHVNTFQQIMKFPSLESWLCQDPLL